jgi:hypothetical protein
VLGSEMNVMDVGLHGVEWAAEQGVERHHACIIFY